MYAQPRQTCHSLHYKAQALLLADFDFDKGEAVQVAPSAPVLLRLAERPWGASATLPSAVVSAIAGHEPARVAVVRDAFAPHDRPPRPLASAIASLGHGRAAVAAAISEPHARMLVDEYELRNDGVYHLTKGSSDMLRCATLARNLSHLCAVR